VGGVAVGVIATGIAAVLVLHRFGGGASAGTSVNLGDLRAVLGENLPNGTTSVMVGELSASDETGSAPNAFVASMLAGGACGSTDLAAKLLQAVDATPAHLLELGILGFPQDENVMRGLRCGDRVRKSLQRPNLVAVSFKEGEANNAETSIALTISAATTEIRDDGTAHNFSGLAGFCSTGASPGACEDDGSGGFRRDGRWFLGRIDVIEAIARTLTTAREDVSTNVEILRRLGDDAGEADQIMLLARPDRVGWSEVCEEAAPAAVKDEFLAACFPPRQEAVIDAIETKLRGVAIQRDFLMGRRRVRWGYLLLGRDEDAARDIERDVQDLLRDWKAHLANTEPTLVRLLQRAGADDPNDALWKEALPALLRAIRAATVERDGDIVRFSITDDLRDDEVRVLREVLEQGRWGRVRDAVSTVVQALIDGTPVPASRLGLIVGPDIAAWMTAPRADAATCAAFRQHLAGLTAAGVGPELFGLKFDLERTLADAHCVGMALPADARGCLTAAPSLDAMGRCRTRVPLAPEEIEARRRTAGQWQATVITGGDRRTRFLLNGMLLEIDGDRLAWSISDNVGRGTVEFSAATYDSAVLVMRLPSGEPSRVSVTLGAEDALATQWEGGVSITFQRTQFAPSLLASTTE
jgi:hypothetical protein